MSRYGFTSKNIVAPLALLPIAFFLMKRGNPNFDTSSKAEDAEAQVAIRKWFIFSTLKNAFGGSSDTTLTRLRELLIACGPSSPFPASALYQSLGIKPTLSDTEIERVLEYGYQGRYTNLVLSLLYPDRDWKDALFHEDHIFPQSEFGLRSLKRRGYDDAKIGIYMARFNTLCNLELLTESENLSKNATPFDEWLESRDAAFRARHLIPAIEEYSFDFFEDFSKERAKLITLKLQSLSADCIQFEGEEDIVPIFAEQPIPTPPKAVEVTHIDDHLGYITDEQVRVKAVGLLDEIKQWKPGRISLDAIKNAISLKVNGRVFAYFWPRRQFYVLGTYNDHEEWKEFSVKEDDDLANVKAMMRAAMERMAE